MLSINRRSRRPRAPRALAVSRGDSLWKCRRRGPGCSWATTWRAPRNVILIGDRGTGKSYLATATRHRRLAPGTAGALHHRRGPRQRAAALRSISSVNRPELRIASTSKKVSWLAAAVEGAHFVGDGVLDVRHGPTGKIRRVPLPVDGPCRHRSCTRPARLREARELLGASRHDNRVSALHKCVCPASTGSAKARGAVSGLQVHVRGRPLGDPSSGRALDPARANLRPATAWSRPDTLA